MEDNSALDSMALNTASTSKHYHSGDNILAMINISIITFSSMITDTQAQLLSSVSFRTRVHPR